MTQAKAFRKASIWLLAMALIVPLFSFSAFVDGKPAGAAGDRKLVGYWHNFDNGSSNIRLREVSPDFDVIQVAFAEPAGGSTSGNMAFQPYNASVSEFQGDIRQLQGQGKKVLISIGGANGTIELSSEQARQNFVSTMKDIIDTYGFNGLDIDLEGSSLSLNGGDTDFRNPTTPKIVNLISAVRDILNSYGSDFMLTMAPETAYVQGGYVAYGGPWGAYLPVIYALREQLDYLHVQHYNSGPMTGLDGKSYAQGTADFQVAMAEMLLQGFDVGGNANYKFPALRPEQLLIGLPATQSAAGGGYTTPDNVHKALDYLMKGQSFGGSYTLRNPQGYPGFKGLMTWSINWDKVANYEFSRSHRAYLDGLGTDPGPGPNPNPDTTPPTAPSELRVTATTPNSITLVWNASTDNVGVAGYTVVYGTSSVNVNTTTATISGLSPNTTYTFTVIAKDAAGNASAAVSVQGKTTAQDNPGEAQPWQAWVSYSVNEQVTYNGSVYTCIQAHTSLPGWEPANVPALWQLK